MLVLTRRVGESIIIGNGVKLTVVSVGAGRVKLGIDAPRSVRIDRQEVHERIEHERGSDVLEAIAFCKPDLAEPATMVVSGPDTGIIAAEAVTIEPTGTTGPTSTGTNAPTNTTITNTDGRKARFRAPRKPR